MLELLRLLSKVTPTLLTHVATTIRIANEPYMPLTVENVGPGPRHLPSLSSATTGSGTATRCATRRCASSWRSRTVGWLASSPSTTATIYAGVEQFAQNQETGEIDRRRVGSQGEFAKQWSRNLVEQGFVVAVASAIFSSLNG